VKQIVFISGKGGTGKSTLVASLNQLVGNKMLADCDVDAPNLHLLLVGERILQAQFQGARVARIDPDRCVSCGLCREVCRFAAIDEAFCVEPLACEGCAACLAVCPAAAIVLLDVKTGETLVDKTSRGTFAHARLLAGAEGKLVTQVRKNLEAFKQDEAYALIDGSPGTGCSVIASITGTDAVVAVAEPTPSGRSDLERVLAVAAHFRVPACVCVNKYDLNLEMTRRICQDCAEKGVPVIGKIPYEPAVMTALQHGQTPVDAGLAPIVDAIQDLWSELVLFIENEKAGDRIWADL
jgi:MinD superfamily P-loop ATPase